MRWLPSGQNNAAFSSDESSMASFCPHFEECRALGVLGTCSTTDRSRRGGATERDMLVELVALWLVRALVLYQASM